VTAASDNPADLAVLRFRRNETGQTALLPLAGLQMAGVGRTNIVNLKAKVRKVDNVAVVEMNGRITLGQETQLLRETIQRLLGEGQTQILLNLGEVGFIDSAGIGELVSAFISARNRGGELKLLKLTKRVRDVVQITKLYTVFDIRDDEAVAIKSFK
jgi:anti-sigma B factor antagonist